jgi:hypothetical protein
VRLRIHVDDLLKLDGSNLASRSWSLEPDVTVNQSYYSYNRTDVRMAYVKTFPESLIPQASPGYFDFFAFRVPWSDRNHTTLQDADGKTYQVPGNTVKMLSSLGILVTS